jgi:hypothetical protein
VKKLLQIITGTVVSVGLMAGTAAADSVTCGGSISNTGPGSNNTITCVDKNDIQVTCSNNDKVVETNNQNANSGGAFTVENTSGGNANSGNANNNNKVTVDVGASCARQVATTATTSPAGGKGAGSASTPATTPSAKAGVSSLPKTGSNSLQDSAITGVFVLGTAAAVSQLAASAYRRFALK